MMCWRRHGYVILRGYSFYEGLFVFKSCVVRLHRRSALQDDFGGTNRYLNQNFTISLFGDNWTDTESEVTYLAVVLCRQENWQAIKK